MAPDALGPGPVGDEAQAPLSQVWHPTRVVEADPLACADWRSVRARDARVNRLTFRHRVGETYKVAFAPRQRWYYFPRVTPDEAVLLKTYDSRDDGGATARFSLHSAFQLPEQAARAADGRPPLPPRASLEVRVLVLWGEGCERLAPDFAPPHMAGPHAAATSDEKSSLVKKETLPASDEW